MKPLFRDRKPVLRLLIALLLFGSVHCIAQTITSPASLPTANRPLAAGPKVSVEELSRAGRDILLYTVQSKTVLKQFLEEFHTCPAEEAAVGIEVINRTKDGQSEAHHCNGLLLRCDGFFLMPSAFTSSRMSSGQKADQQTIQVTLHPGAPQATRAIPLTPRITPKGIDYMVLRLGNIHVPAARTLMPETLKPGDEVEIVWTDWDPQAGKFSALQRRTAKLAELPKSAEEAKKSGLLPGEIQFTEMQAGIPSGAVVIGPERMALGILPADSRRHDRFLSFSVLPAVTGCVVPYPTTDRDFEILQKRPRGGEADPDMAGTEKAESAEVAPPRQDPAEENGMGGSKHPVNDMVTVPGGPIKLPLEIYRNHAEMQNFGIACVAEFKIDRYKVSNGEYYAFWKSIPAKERNNKEVRAALYPIAWADTDPPFPSTLVDVPVLGVPLSGAQAYAHSQGKRLPTPYEWCRAAFGPLGDAAAPVWVQRYMLDRQLTWKRLVLSQIAYLSTLNPMLNRTRELLNIDRFVRKFSPIPMIDLAARSSIPYLSTDEALTEACRWSKQQVTKEVERICQEWKDPLYVLPSGSRPFDVSPYGVMDMVLNGNELVTASPDPALRGSPEYVHIAWREGIASSDGFEQLLNKSNREWFESDILMNDNESPSPPLLSRRLLSSSSRVHANSNEFCPSWSEDWMELASRIYETALMIYPIGEMQVRTEWANTFECDAWGEGSVEFYNNGMTLAHRHPPCVAFQNVIPGPLTIPMRPNAMGGVTQWQMDSSLNPRLDVTFWPANIDPNYPKRTGDTPAYYGEPYLDEVFGVKQGLFFNETPYYRLWAGLSPFMKQEMGREWAKDPPVHFGVGPRSSNPMVQPADIFLIPNGFRCAR